MRTFVFEQLYERGFIAEETLKNILEKERNKPVSIALELKVLMYVGIVLLTTGLGIVVYKNIDSIGHLSIVLAIAIATVSCFTYSIVKAPPFIRDKVVNTNLINDYILLIGCLLLLILIGYLQFEYNLFGDRWGMATFVPMAILFISAYYFDHLGVLSMAVVNLAAWTGISVTPLRLLHNNDFNNSTIIFTALALGLFLQLVAMVSVLKNIKAHFSFTYKNFGIHILFIAAIFAIINFRTYEMLWLVFLSTVCFWQVSLARKEKSFYFLTIALLYFYFGLSYVAMRNLFSHSSGEGALYAALIYFIITATLFGIALTRFNKIVKENALV